MTAELAFVLAPGQNLFFFELVRALQAELSEIGVPNSVHVGNFPAPRPDLVYVLVPPHEYFTLLHGRRGPLPEVLKRTIFICAEQPNTPFFESNVELAPRGGAVFDINRLAVRAFQRQGVVAHHLQLGWTPVWDHMSDRERDIDVLFMGSATERRLQFLSSYARTFSRYRTELVISDNSRPNHVASDSYRTEEDKWDLLTRSKVLVNLHQENNPYFEWLRVVQAISCGTVVVSEHSVDYAPLTPGRHLLMGEPGALHLLAAMLLEDEHRRWQMQTDAYETIRRDIPLATSVAELASVASGLAVGDPIHEVTDRFFTQPQPDPKRIRYVSDGYQPTGSAGGDVNASWIRRGLKDLRLELMQLRRGQEQADLVARNRRPPPRIQAVATTRAYGAAAPRISVLTALYNHSEHIRGALESARRSGRSDLELIVIDDGSADASAETVRAWMQPHQDLPVLLLRHPVNRGLAETRNDALSVARGEYCFVLDADNEVYPRCLDVLVAALDEQPAAAFAYTSLEKFDGGGSIGLMNLFPWEPRRLRAGNFVDAMAMLRTSIIRDEAGGYPSDRRLHGWEDYALWCALAEAGHIGIRIPEILGRYRVARHSMLSVTNMSATDAFSLIIEANPCLMEGVEPPD